MAEIDVRETPKHTQAFEQYYLMPDRTLERLAGDLNLHPSTVKRWSVEFNWQERIVQRDLENRKPLEEQTNRRVVDMRAAEIAKIAKSIEQLELDQSYMTAVYAGAKEKIEKKELSVDSIRDLTELEKARLLNYKEVREQRKQQFALMGEPLDKIEVSGDVKIIIDYGDSD